MPGEQPDETFNTIFDLRNCDFDGFVDFLFKHPVANREAGEDPWYRQTEAVLFDPVQQTMFYTQLFMNSSFLLDRFTREELGQGFWAPIALCLDGSVFDLLGDKSIPIDLLEKCIRSMFLLFRDLFAKDDFDSTACNMWWDCLSDHFSLSRNRDEARQQAIRQAMFETLEQILGLESEECRGAALHGLGHLQHADTERVILAFIDAHPEMDEDDREYCMDCISGDIM